MRNKKYILAVAMLLLAQCYSFAQVDMKNTGVLYVTGHTDTLYINGAFVNSSTAALTNNGQLQVKLNLTNDQASMATGTGTLHLNGSSAQSVNGSSVFKTYNLITNNTAGFTLNNNLSISGSHTFMNGLIATSVTPNYLIYEAGSSYSGDGDSHHVTGWVKKFGATDFTFPVGSNTYERPVTVTNLSAISEINTHYYSATSNIYNLSSPIVQVKTNEYWQVDKISGGTGKVTLNWNHPKMPMDNERITDIHTTQYTAGKWIDAGGTASGSITAAGTVTSNTLTSFGAMTFGYSAFPVPLKLISFTGERVSGISYLKWVTDNEENVDHIEIQRSNDAITYTTTGQVPARNSGQREQYHFEDGSAVQGLVYYRLKNVDRDGKFEYSRIVVMSENNLTQGTFVVINPVQSAITIINKTNIGGAFNYRVSTLAGQQLMAGTASMALNAGTALPLPVQVANGIYVLELANERIRFRQEVMVKR